MVIKINMFEDHAGTILYLLVGEGSHLDGSERVGDGSERVGDGSERDGDGC